MNTEDHRFLPDDTRISLCHCRIIDQSGKSETQFQWRDRAKGVPYSTIMLSEDEARSYPIDQLKPQ